MATRIDEKRIRELLGNPDCLTEQDYADLAGSANADPDESAEWLPYYKLALALLMQAFGVAMSMARSCPNKDVPALARSLARLHFYPCGIGPDGSPEKRKEVEAKIGSERDVVLNELMEG